MFTRCIHLVRHGVTEWNRDARFQGHINVPLSAAGREQAAAIAARLSEETVAYCFASDLSRAFNTVQVIVDHLAVPIELDPDLREANKGDFEGMYLDPRTGLIGDETRFHDENDVHACPPGGGKYCGCPAALRTVRAAGRHLGDRLPEEDLLFVSHGGTMRALMAVLLDLPLDASRSFRFDNCGLTTVQFRGDIPPLLLAYNDCVHLEVRTGA